MPARLRLGTEQTFASGFAVRASLDVALDPGSVLVLFGPSGAGKTTLLRQIAGLERPDRGAIAFDGDTWCDTDRGQWSPPQARRLGVVFQEPMLFPHLTVAENIRFGGRRRDGGGTEVVAEIAMVLGIADLENRYPRQLSGGQAQRVALARALVTRPRLLLLDEPFASLDEPTRARLRRDVRALLHRTGTPAMLVTHDRTEALAVGDLMAVVIAGAVRQVDTVAGVFARPADADVAAALGIEAVVPARIVDVSDGVLEVAVDDVVLHVAEREAVEVGAVVYACIRAEDVTVELESPARPASPSELRRTGASARNHLPGTVTAITPEGPIDRVTLDCGFALDALITRRSREELRLRPGSRVTAAIKATSIHLVPRL